MSKYLVIEVTSPDLSIADLNDKCHSAGNSKNALNKLIDYLGGISGGSYSGTVKVVTKDASTTISTSGAGSTSETYTP